MLQPRGVLPPGGHFYLPLTPHPIGGTEGRKIEVQGVKGTVIVCYLLLYLYYIL